MNKALPIPVMKVIEVRQRLLRIHPRFAVFFDIGVETGLRVSDILALRARDICTGVITVVEKKTRKSRCINLDPDLFLYLTGYVMEYGLRPSDYLVFRSPQMRSEPLSRTQIYKVMSRVGDELGIAQLSPHSMRKTYAVRLFHKTKSIEAVRKELNHSSAATTMLYVFGELREPAL